MCAKEKKSTDFAIEWLQQAGKMFCVAEEKNNEKNYRHNRCAKRFVWEVRQTMKHTIMLKKSGFQKVYKRAKGYAETTMVMLCIANGNHQNKLGVVASKKVGGAVVRNRARRRLKELYRNSEQNLRIGYDIVLIARSGIEKAEHPTLKKSFIQLAKRHKIWVQAEKKWASFL